MTPLIVQKYGGTSVGTIERIQSVAQRIARHRETGVNIVVVVSAMAGETDKLLKLAAQVTDRPERRELDLLLSSGERISSALLTMALHAIGCPAVAMTGRQIGIQTDNIHTRARIQQIDAERCLQVLEKNHVVVVAGFQGINQAGDVTTLGRGGSDTSAVALASALKAEKCEIYTDVNGVYTADPNIVPDARKLDVVFYDEMLEMASLGAKVLQIRCVEFAKKYTIPVIVRSSYNDEEGTLICKEDPKMEQPVVSGIMQDKNQAKITVKGVPDQPGIAANLFTALAEAAISVDMIIQNISVEGHTDISFTVTTEHLPDAMNVTRIIAEQIRAENITTDASIAKISIVGAGMKSHSGIAALMFKTFSKENINIMMISTSEIKISCVIEREHSERAVRALHDAFELNSGSGAAILRQAPGSARRPMKDEPLKKPRIIIYDTTLRDGSQSEDISFTVEDKIRIAHKLDELGVHYVEGGWPGSNPRDIDFFKRVQHSKFEQTRITSFGSTRFPGKHVEKDLLLQELLKTETEVVTIFGKSWDLHVQQALGTDEAENLRMISESVAYLKKHGKEVIFDAEHFFDGHKKNPEYAAKAVKEAESAGADWIVLCDTNGGSMPWEIWEVFNAVKKDLTVPLGIHCHNDSELAVANTLNAVIAGATQIQGTVNGLGERCGNANLISILPNLKFKMGFDCITGEQMRRLKDVSSFVDELANKAHWNQRPFVGQSAFAHKGGVHVSAVQKNPQTYEHMDPETVGNHRRILISDLSGKSNILYKAKEFGIDVNGGDPKVQNILETLKNMENLGYQYEGAEGSFELLMHEALGDKEIFFEFVGFRVIVEKRREDEQPLSEATVKVRVNGVQEVTAAEGTGPVNALDKAIKKALIKFYPELEEVNLYDYKVRILDEKKGTRSKTRVLVESGDHHSKWGTVGVSENIIEASWQALVDSIEYKLNAFKNKNSSQ